MTYTEAAMHNQQCPARMQHFKDPKQIADGVNLRWLELPDGSYGYVRGCNSDGVLVMIPLKTLKNHVCLSATTVSHEYWKSANKLRGVAQ